MKLVNVNRKREKDTYGKMFQKTKSVADWVDKNKVVEPKMKTLEDLEEEEENKELELKVKKYMETKKMEFSFEVSEDKKHFKEVDDLQEMVE